MFTDTNDAIEAFIDSGEPAMPDPTHGDGYRCSAILKDGTELPCVIIRRNDRIIENIIKSVDVERRGRTAQATADGPQRDFFKALATGGNRIAHYEIESVRPSRFAMPLSILNQVEGETVMSWTGFVLEMSDGALLTFGTSFRFEFFQLPDQYDFADVVGVHNHSFVDRTGAIVNMRADPTNTNLDYDDQVTLYRERVFFECYVDRP